MNKNGFTIVELIAVVAIMIVISIIVTVNLTNLSRKSDDKRYNEFKRQVQDAACVYIDLTSHRAEKNSCYSSGCTVTVQNIINEGLISKDLVNPKTDEVVDPTLTVSISWSTAGVKTCTLNIQGD